MNSHRLSRQHIGSVLMVLLTLRYFLRRPQLLTRF
jgi:hypothetical protein